MERDRNVTEPNHDWTKGNLETYKTFVIERSNSFQTPGTFSVITEGDRSIKMLGKKQYGIYFKMHRKWGMGMKVNAWTAKGAIVSVAHTMGIEASLSMITY